MNRIDFYATDETIQNLIAQYGAALERLGPQRFRLMRALATEGIESGPMELESDCFDIARELAYLDPRARAGVIAALARQMWEDS
ncbi:hypothetical protein IQ266_10255 [filamentous cyanobacterium LEGE 11480]|uniref:Uncharacterized protein n=1 Tax=Romeriopsis navalis LEGE 11480 TaxID=2777977 RepID=A0A928Z4C3_9CYAN|nr:hypothetical protein [Romeriopsis navalis]MBE9030110.1 hypothetical protein [Romeriopsis navalis LEGE 11480]